MDEFSFINSIKQSLYKQSSLVKGVGDDAAVFRQQTQDIVTAVDTFVENIHFTRQTMPPFYIGYRDRKSTRLNSSHVAISYAVFRLKKKTHKTILDISTKTHVSRPPR